MSSKGTRIIIYKPVFSPRVTYTTKHLSQTDLVAPLHNLLGRALQLFQHRAPSVLNGVPVHTHLFLQVCKPSGQWWALGDEVLEELRDGAFLLRSTAGGHRLLRDLGERARQH